MKVLGAPWGVVWPQPLLLVGSKSSGARVGPRERCVLGEGIRTAVPGEAMYLRGLGRKELPEMTVLTTHMLLGLREPSEKGSHSPQGRTTRPFSPLVTPGTQRKALSSHPLHRCEN